MGQLKRALQVMHYLRRQGAVRFEELVKLLSPVSRTTVSALLQELVEAGEVEHRGRFYHAAPGNELAAGASIYELPPVLREQTQVVLGRLCAETGLASALFARVGVMTMKIMDEAVSPEADWRFSVVGYEWPLVPFHGFAKLFLAHASEAHARHCFGRWHNHLRPELCVQDWAGFARELATVRRKGYALEYQEEGPEILRLAVPVPLDNATPVCFAVGVVARFIHLIEVEAWLAPLRAAADELGGILKDRTPNFRFYLPPRT